MPNLPSTLPLRSLRSIPTSTYSIASTRSLSSTRALKAGGGHESPYDPPTGNLFGVPPGEKYKKEGWEGIFFWGFFGSLGLGAVAYAFKPDTSIQTWALEEARRRLEKEGLVLTDESVKRG